VKWARRFLVHGVFWRQFLRWAVINVPIWIEPMILGWWSALFLFWGPGRRGVMHNLRAIKPRSWSIANFFRVYRVFWNFAWTIADNVRHREDGMIPDWEFIGIEHFDALQSRDGGAIILTAHMGSYDLGAQLFAEYSAKKIVMVRAPEIDPDTRKYEEARLSNEVQVSFNTAASDLALDLLRPQGKLVLKSTFHGSTEIDAARIVVDEISIVGSRCGRFQPALHLLTKDAIDVASLISEEHRLADGLKAMDRAKTSGILKVLLRP